MKGFIVIAIIVLLLLACFGSFIGSKNQMVTKNEAVKAAWSQVDIVLQRRADLIPNLVETVKGLSLQEQTVFGDIAKARSRLLSAINFRTLAITRPTQSRCKTWSTNPQT